MLQELKVEQMFTSTCKIQLNTQFQNIQQGGEWQHNGKSPIYISLLEECKMEDFGKPISLK